MSNTLVAILAAIFSFAIITATIVGCVGRAEAVMAYNPDAPV